MSMKRPFPDSDAVMLKTDVLLKNNNGSMSVLSYDVPTKERFGEYSKNSGVVYENSSSIFDFNFANLAENLQEQSKKLYEEFNNVKPDVDSAYQKSIKLRVDDINFENVFHKFRGCLDMYRDEFAVEIDKVPSLIVGSTTYDVAYLKQSTPTISSYVDMNNTADVKTMVEMLESIKNKVLDILKNPPAATSASPSTAAATAPSAASSPSASSATSAPAPSTAASTTPASATPSTTAASPSTAASTSTAAATAPPSLSSLSYNDKDIENINKNDFTTWTAKEVGILEEPQNHENVLYVIGQVFNIIPPDYYESFLTDKPSTSSSASSASSLSSVSKTNFFKFIVKDPASNIMSISKDGTLYVGETNGPKKQGKGMMRWANGSIFEGTFANDFIENGTFNGQPLVSSNATTGTATLDGTAGTFNMDTGEFTPTVASP
jgi:hypothetical protein